MVISAAGVVIFLFLLMAVLLLFPSLPRIDGLSLSIGSAVYCLSASQGWFAQ
jgi:hypothetical protein